MAAITYKCPNCGGGLVFDPGTQKYKCVPKLNDAILLIIFFVPGLLWHMLH